MSLAVKPVPSYVCIDPRINLHENYEYIIPKSGMQNTNQVVNAITANQSSIVFSNIPPSVSTYLSRKIYIKVRFSIAFGGVNATPGTNLVQLGTHDSLKAWPLQSQMIQTATATINNTAVSVNSSDVMGALLRTNLADNLQRYDLSLTPGSILDHHQNYSDSENPAYPWFDQYSMNDLEMGPVGQGYQDGRGGFVYVSRTKIDDNNEIIVYDVTEPLVLAPFIYQAEEQGLIGVNNINLNLTLSSTALQGGLWSHSSFGNTLNSVVATVQSAQLLLNFITPPVTAILPRGPVCYPYWEINRYITDLGTINANSLLSGAQSNNIQLNCIPSRIYIYAKRSTNTVTFNTPDVYSYLENLNITFSNRNSILGSSDPRQLYEIAVKNGLKNCSWTAWSRDQGSILIIDPVEDLGLNDDQSSGLLDQIQLQVRVDVKNINMTTNIPFQLYIVVINPGVFTIDTSNQSAVSQIGVISKSDIINSALLPVADYHAMKSIYGGDFVSNVRDAGKKLISFGKSALPYVQKGIDLAKRYGPAVLSGAEKAVALAPEALALVGLGEMDGSGRRRKRKLKNRY